MSSNTKYYTEDHEWVSYDGSLCTIGITQYAADELGEIVYVDLKEAGEAIEAKDEFGLTYNKLKLAKPEALVLHPGPINRGVEISSQVADGENAIILDQVLNGVAIRMSILFLLLGAQQ